MIQSKVVHHLISKNVLQVKTSTICDLKRIRTFPPKLYQSYSTAATTISKSELERHQRILDQITAKLNLNDKESLYKLTAKVSHIFFTTHNRNSMKQEQQT
jgi:prephenate dehydrogenase